MRHISSATAVALSLLGSSILFGQANGLSITNYQFVSETFYSRTQSKVTYRADLSNTGPAQTSVTATLTGTGPGTQIIPGSEKLHFTNVPSNGSVTASDTFTILVDRTVTFDFKKLVWSFEVPVQPPPIADAGPNQSGTVGQLVTLNGSGSSNPSGKGTLTYSWAFTSRPGGSNATLNNATSVISTFVPDVPGNYVIALTVNNGVASSTASTTVSTTLPTAPVAKAGPDQTVKQGATVVLNGGGSTSGSGKPLTYKWTLTSVPAGSTATLNGANTISPTFVADKAGNYVAQLIVNDGIADSAPSTVTITTTGPVKPVANAGPSQKVNVGTAVQLDGSGSTDSNGLPLTYKWSLISVPAGSAATLSSTTAVKPTFTADVPGNYVAQLIVNNGTLDSDPSTVTITTNTIMAPTANAGPNQTVQNNSTVQLNGSGTDPQNLPLTYKFTLISKPANSSATLSSGSIANPTFVADLPGNYVAQLVTNNGFLDSAPSTVTISTTCAPPTANAGPVQNVTVGATVTLNGGASGDLCRDPLTYSWTFTSIPAGSKATLSGANTVSPTFVADVVGTYVAQLIVNNGFSNSTPATVTVNAGNAGTLTLAPNPLTFTLNTPGTLTLTLSTPAGPNGLVVNLTSSNTAAATVPGSVNVAANGTTANIPVTGVAQGSSTITATAASYTSGTGTVIVAPPGTITLSGSTVPVGQSAPFAVTLSSPAPAGGLTVTLTSSDPSKVTIPGSVTIAAGQTTPLTQPQVTGVAFGSSTITASAPGFTSATQTVQATLTMTLAPATLPLILPNTGNLTLTLSGPAPSGGLTVNLSSSSTATATVPSTVTVAAGATTANIQVTSVGAGSATITASATNAGSATATVNVTNPGSFTLPSNATVPVGQTVAFPITLGSPAASDVTITLTSSDPTKVTIAPGTITILAGQTAPATQPQIMGVAFGSANISASAPNFTTATAPVQATLSITLAPGTLPVTAGFPAANLTLTLSAPAPTGGLTVNVTSSNTNFATVPSTVSVAAGATTVSIPVTGVAVGTATITASATNAGSATATATVTSAGTINLPSNATVAVGQTTAFPITLSKPAPADVTITLASSDGSKVTIAPTTVTIPSGQTTPATQPQITGVGFGTANITATSPGYPNASAAVQTTLTMTLAPASIAIPAGLGGSLTLTLSGPAPTGGLTVNVSSSNASAATVPGSVSVAAGATTVNIPVVGVAPGTATITASATNAGSATSSVTVGLPIQISLQSGVTVAVGATAPIAVTLSQGAPAGGVTINLASSDPSKVTVPGSVFIAAGQTTPATQPQVTGVASGSANITASANGYTSATQAVTVPSAQSLSFSPGNLTINPPYPGVQNITLSLTTGPTSPLTVNLSSNNTAVATVPSTVTFAVGQTTIQVPVTAVSGPGSATITANAPNLTALATINTVIQQGNILVGSTSVGKDLQSQVAVTIPGPANPNDPINPNGTTVKVTTSDITKVALGGAGAAQVNLFIAPGTLTGFVIVQGRDSTGSATLTASAANVTSGTGTVNLSPSGFVLSSPNGIGQGFQTAVGSTATLTVTPARLDSSFNFVEAQPLRNGVTATVNIGSSTPSVGTVSPGSLTFGGGDTPQNATFSANGNGSTSVSINTPAGFSTPSQGTSLTAIVNKVDLLAGNATVGKGLETTTQVLLSGPAPADFDLTLTSNDPSKLLLSATPDGAGSTSITLKVQGGTGGSPVFYVYGLASSGQATYTASASGFTSATGTVTLAPSGFVLQGPGGLGAGSFSTTAQAGLTPLTVRSALLDANGGFAATQAVAGGTSVNVSVTSSNTSTGTITTSPVTITGGNSSASSAFSPAADGTTTLSVVTPSGFNTAQFSQIVATVKTQSLSVTDFVTIGQRLELPGQVGLPQAQSTPVTVTLTSGNPSQLLLSGTPQGAGSASIQVVIPAGSTSASYYMQAVGSSGTASYTASALNFASRTATQIALAPSAVVISAPPLGLSVFSRKPVPDNVSLSGGPSTITISVGYVNPDGTLGGANIQQLAGGQPLSVNLTNSNPSIGTVPATAIIQPGNDHVDVTFTPLAQGATTISVVQPAGFTAPTHGPSTLDAPFTSLVVNVGP